MREPEFCWHCYRKRNVIQLAGCVVGVLIYPAVWAYRKLKRQ